MFLGVVYEVTVLFENTLVKIKISKILYSYLQVRTPNLSFTFGPKAMDNFRISRCHIIFFIGR